MLRHRRLLYDSEDSEADLDLNDGCFADASNLSVNVVDLLDKTEFHFQSFVKKTEAALNKPVRYFPALLHFLQGS